MNTKKEIIVFFGRCNPPTRAHVMVWEQTKQIALERNCDYKVYITHTHDAYKNPLPPKVKLGWCKTIAPDITFTLTGGKSGIRTPIEAINSLIKKGYSHITIVAGDDRKEFEELLKKYLESPCDISFVSAGNRKEDFTIASGHVVSIESVSGTALREYIYSIMQTDDAFSLMPSSLSFEQKVALYYDVLLGSGYVSKSSKLRNAARQNYLARLKKSR